MVDSVGPDHMHSMSSDPSLYFVGRPACLNTRGKHHMGCLLGQVRKNEYRYIQIFTYYSVTS